jgi:hypothetical protein
MLNVLRAGLPCGSGGGGGFFFVLLILCMRRRYGAAFVGGAREHTLV